MFTLGFFIKRNWRVVAFLGAIAAVMVVAYAIYSHGYQAGHAVAENACQARALARQSEWDKGRRATQQKLENSAAAYLAAEARITDLEQQRKGVWDADILCPGPVFSDSLSKRIDAVGRD